MMKRLSILGLIGVLSVGSLTGCGKLDDGAVVATVDGDEVSAGLANFYARMTQAQYQAWFGGYIGEDMWTQQMSEEQNYEEYVKEQVMEDLQRMFLLEDHMADYKVELTEDEKAAISKAAEEFVGANEEDDAGKVSGTKENVERFLTLFTIRNKMDKAIRAGADTEVSDEEAARKTLEYVRFATSSAEGDEADVADEAAKGQADIFYASVTSGEDFAAMADNVGNQVLSASFDADETETVPEEVAKAADALEVGGITEVIETSDGYYVARVTSLFDQEATDQEKEKIVAEREQQLYDDTMEGWKKDAKISVKKKVWDKVDFKKLIVTMHQETEE